MEITLSEVRAHCITHGVGFEIDPSGMMRLAGRPRGVSEVRQAIGTPHVENGASVDPLLVNAEDRRRAHAAMQTLHSLRYTWRGGERWVPPLGPAPAFLASDILGKAAGHMAQRASTYDKPEGERSMAQTVAVFNTFHGTKLTEAQGWHFMQVLKDVRLFTRPTYHADSAEDGVAYSALKAEAKAAEVPPAANDNPSASTANRA